MTYWCPKRPGKRGRCMRALATQRCAWCERPLELSVPTAEAGPRSDGSAALESLAALGSDVATLLSAVQGGAHLRIDGPSPVLPTKAFSGELESATGARCIRASGESLKDVLAELARKWAARP